MVDSNAGLNGDEDLYSLGNELKSPVYIRSVGTRVIFAYKFSHDGVYR